MLYCLSSKDATTSGLQAKLHYSVSLSVHRNLYSEDWNGKESIRCGVLGICKFNFITLFKVTFVRGVYTLFFNWSFHDVIISVTNFRRDSVLIKDENDEVDKRDKLSWVTKTITVILIVLVEQNHWFAELSTNYVY